MGHGKPGKSSSTLMVLSGAYSRKVLESNGISRPGKS